MPDDQRPEYADGTGDVAEDDLRARWRIGDFRRTLQTGSSRLSWTGDDGQMVKWVVDGSAWKRSTPRRRKLQLVLLSCAIAGIAVDVTTGWPWALVIGMLCLMTGLMINLVSPPADRRST